MKMLDRYHARTGKRIPQRPITLAQRRVNQALQRAFPIRRGTQVTTTTVTFTTIGQPQHITTPTPAIPYRKFVRMTTHHY